MVHDLQVPRKCYKISRNLGNLIDLLIFCKTNMLLVWIREALGVNPWCWSQGPEINSWRRQNDNCVEITFVFLNSLFVSPEDGATWETDPAQWRHHVMMMMMMMITSLDDQDSRNITSSTWQLCDRPSTKVPFPKSAHSLSMLANTLYTTIQTQDPSASGASSGSCLSYFLPLPIKMVRTINIVKNNNK